MHLCRCSQWPHSGHFLVHPVVLRWLAHEELIQLFWFFWSFILLTYLLTYQRIGLIPDTSRYIKLKEMRRLRVTNHSWLIVIADRAVILYTVMLQMTVYSEQCIVVCACEGMPVGTACRSRLRTRRTTSCQGWVRLVFLGRCIPDCLTQACHIQLSWRPHKTLHRLVPRLLSSAALETGNNHCLTLTFDLAFRSAFRSAEVRSKSRLKSKSKVISLSERLRPNLRSKYRLKPKLSWTLV